MDIVIELEKFCDYAIEVGYLDELDKSPLINIYLAHFYNSSGLDETQAVRQNEYIESCDRCNGTDDKYDVVLCTDCQIDLGLK